MSTLSHQAEDKSKASWSSIGNGAGRASLGLATLFLVLLLSSCGGNGHPEYGFWVIADRSQINGSNPVHIRFSEVSVSVEFNFHHKVFGGSGEPYRYETLSREEREDGTIKYSVRLFKENSMGFRLTHGYTIRMVSEDVMAFINKDKEEVLYHRHKSD